MYEKYGLKYVEFKEVKEKFLNYFKNRNIIPIIGAGFTQGSSSDRGIVPDAEGCKNHMLKLIRKSDADLADELRNDNLSEVSSYFKNLDITVRRKFFREYFTKVKLSQSKKKFLSIDWWYVYTLNIDDAIERNSMFSNVININRKFTITKEYKYVKKLHGDVDDFNKYDDSEIIFTDKEYIKSINTNKYLLADLKTDYESNNLIFIGCSLTSEFDILSIVDDAKSMIDIMIVNNEQYGRKDSERLKRYKINTVILVNDYDEFYQEIYDTWKGSANINNIDMIPSISREKINIIDPDYEKDKEYLFFGEDNFSDGKITFPSFYIERNMSSVLNHVLNSRILILYGGIFSGKTYYIYGIARKVNNKTMYVLSSKTRIDDKVIEDLLKRKNILLLVDTHVLTTEQVDYIIKNEYLLEKNDNHVIIAAYKNDQTINDMILALHNKEQQCGISKFTIKPKLNKFETDEISKKLSRCEISGFENNVTIINNIISISDSLKLGNKFQDIIPNLNEIQNIAAMIMLAIDKKIYLKDANKFEIKNVLDKESAEREGLISIEKTISYEKNTRDTSSYKYVLNADCWLLKNMREFAKEIENRRKIIEGYEYIIDKIIDVYGEPDIKYGNNKMYCEYIKFDNINKIFNWNNSNGDNLNLIREIYVDLKKKLSAEPNFMHQMAKCYIRCAYYNSDKRRFFDSALRVAIVAKKAFEKRYKESNNDKVKISYDHTLYTIGVIQSNIAKTLNYEDNEANQDAVDALSEAFNSKNNSYSYLKNDRELDRGNMIRAIIEAFNKNTTDVNLKIKYLDKLKQLENIIAPNGVFNC